MAAPLVDLLSRPAMYSPKVESSLCRGASFSPLLGLPSFIPADPTVSLPAASIQFIGSGDLEGWYKTGCLLWLYLRDAGQARNAANAEPTSAQSFTFYHQQNKDQIGPE